MARHRLTQNELEYYIEHLSELSSDEEVNQHMNAEEDVDLSDAASMHSGHLSESEIEASDSEEEVETDDEMTDLPPGNYFYGKNRFKWAKTEPASSRTRLQNIVTDLSGLKGPAATNKPEIPFKAWSLLFTDDILEIILEYTNAKITELSTNYGNTATFVDHIDKTELKAFLGLLLLSGVYKSGREDAAGLFAADGTGRDVFRATMSLKRFLFLLLAVRFDEQNSREQRVHDGDKLAAISEIFNIFINNARANYTCSEYATVDEMLVGFRGRCSFRQYLKSKPRKYGIKIMCLCDSKNHYLLNAFVYVGKESQQQNPEKLSVPTLSVLRLVQPILKTNRNITGDNWFSSIELVNKLLQNDLTYVGTVRKNKGEIPHQFLPNRNRMDSSSEFGFTRNLTLVSFVPKKNRSVILVSSMHHSRTIAESGKPEIIELYNSTKSGVDSLDQKCTTYSCQRRTRRWPLAVFYAMLDISRVNAYVLFKCANVDNKMSRRSFTILLGKSLINDHLKRRMNMKQLSRELKATIQKVLGENTSDNTDQRNTNMGGPAPKQRRCNFCPRTKDRKVKTFCQKCQAAVCKDHSVNKCVCQDCDKTMQ